MTPADHAGAERATADVETSASTEYLSGQIAARDFLDTLGVVCASGDELYAILKRLTGLQADHPRLRGFARLIQKRCERLGRP